MFRHDQSKQQIHRPLVERVEVDARVQFQQCSECLLAAFDASMRQRYAVPEAGAAEALARGELIEQLMSRQFRVAPGKHLTKHFQRPLLAGYGAVALDPLWADQVGDVHHTYRNTAI